ncbi:MAG: hypothetical protein ACJAT2_001218 [Bacteriovoracaceae bacterium]|jgi:hypothetical protein
MEKNILELMILVFLALLIPISVAEGSSPLSLEYPGFFERYLEGDSLTDARLCPDKYVDSYTPLFKTEESRFCGFFDSSMNQGLPNSEDSYRDLYEENESIVQGSNSI